MYIGRHQSTILRIAKCIVEIKMCYLELFLDDLTREIYTLELDFE